MKVLITGGAGYVGSVLVNYLLNKNYKVRVLDNLLFGGEHLSYFLTNPNFEFLYGDIREKTDLQKAMKNTDIIIHLAAIVGDPACKKESQKAVSTNLEGTILTYKTACENKTKRFIFASTCSNYGKMEENIVDENSPLRPVSLYARTKVDFESYLQNESSNLTKWCILRFSTVFGLSFRMRFDLTINDFTKELTQKNELVIFGEQFYRPYIHVNDLARAIYLVLTSDEKKFSSEIYNAGDTSFNYTKKC